VEIVKTAAKTQILRIKYENDKYDFTTWAFIKFVSYDFSNEGFLSNNGGNGLNESSVSALTRSNFRCKFRRLSVLFSY